MSGQRRLVATRAQRLDKLLAEAFPEESRSSLQRWIRDERVRGARPLKASTKLLAGEAVEVEPPPPPPPPSPLKPEDISVPLLYQDAAILVLDKPAGLTVHPGSGQSDGTLVNALLALGGPLSTVGGEERPGIVHRLDKDTSGVMVVARTDVAHRSLSAQFKERRTDKRYAALVHGAPPDAGTIDKPLGRHVKDRKRQAVRYDGGRPAVTHFQVEERFGEVAARVSLKIETGRTHQIRVHMASLGHGIVGDATYGRPRSPAAREVIARQALHAARLEFDHPVSGQRVAFEAPLPPDIVEAAARLRGLEREAEDGR